MGNFLECPTALYILIKLFYVILYLYFNLAFERAGTVRFSKKKKFIKHVNTLRNCSKLIQEIKKPRARRRRKFQKTCLLSAIFALFWTSIRNWSGTKDGLMPALEFSRVGECPPWNFQGYGNWFQGGALLPLRGAGAVEHWPFFKLINLTQPTHNM